MIACLTPESDRGIRLKTVELIVEEKPWRPRFRYRDEDVVQIIVAYTETALRDMLKIAGGRWDPEAKLWLVSYGSVRGTELEERILQNDIKRKRVRKYPIWDIERHLI